MLGDAVRKSAAAVGEALDVLTGLMRGATSESVKRQAATDLLSAARALKTDAEVDEKLRDLQAALDAVLPPAARR